jgi:hypothetical protein
MSSLAATKETLPWQQFHKTQQADLQKYDYPLDNSSSKKTFEDNNGQL